jgi:4-aminobutyrate aminotransferase
MTRDQTNAHWAERLKNAIPSGIGIGNNIFAAKAKNALLWDIEGKRYIDFAGGIGVLNSGHCNPDVINAAKAQLDKFTHTCFQVVPYTGYVELAEKLNAITPGDFPKKTMLLSSGAEAVENSIKISRMATKRSAVIAFSGAFHGRTLFAAGLTGKVNPYKTNLGLISRDIFHVPFPAIGASLDRTKQAVEDIFKSDIEPSQVAAIIFEPVQGEGGFYQIQKEAILWIRQLCDQHGIVMIADEVQCGFARTGKMFAMEHYGAQADLVISAKSLAGGFTLAAITGRQSIMDGTVRGALGGTYPGNPVAVAAALAVIEVMEKDNLSERSEYIGSRVEAKLAGLVAKLSFIKEFRRLGAMAAVEFINPETQAPNPEIAQMVQKYAFNEGLIILTCGMYGNVIRFLSPLTIEEDVLDEGLDIFESALLSI